MATTPPPPPPRYTPEEAFWGPPRRPYHRVLWNGTTGDPHADRIDAGLLAIPAARVIAALDELPAAVNCHQKVRTWSIDA